MALQIDAIVEHMATVPKLGRPPAFGECAKGHAPGGCTEGSLYGYQTGCHGDACRAKNAEYYEQWRASHKDTTPAVKDVGKLVAEKRAAAPKRRSPKTAPEAASTPAAPVKKAAPAKPTPTKRVSRRSPAT